MLLVNSYGEVRQGEDGDVQSFLMTLRCSFQVSIVLKPQPAKSPDLNMLDLGIWYSLAHALPFIITDPKSFKKVHSSVFLTSRVSFADIKVHDRIVDTVEWGWKRFNSLKLTQVCDTKSRILRAVVDDEGSHEYEIPRTKLIKERIPAIMPYLILSLPLPLSAHLLTAVPRSVLIAL